MQAVYTNRQGEKLFLKVLRVTLFFFSAQNLNPTKILLQYLTKHVAEDFLLTISFSFAGFKLHHDSKLHINVIENFCIFMLTVRNEIEGILFLASFSD